MWPFNKNLDQQTTTTTTTTIKIDDGTGALPAGNNQLGGIVGTSNPFGSSGGAGGSGGSGGLIIGPSGTLTVQQIQQMLQGFMQSLSQAEQAELSQLRADFEIQKKSLKLAEFKKLPTELRQFVINAAMWQSHVTKINETKPEESDRLKELSQKEMNNKQWGGGLGTIHTGMSQWATTSTGFILTSMPMPEGLTVEDLVSAHSEQCLEEEMLDEKA